jgi:transcriptional regulator with XRE-family HTH domain
VGFSNKLKEYRVKRGLTQKKLSEMSNVSRATIAGIESGAISTTTTDTILKLSNTLKVPVSRIFFT